MPNERKSFERLAEVVADAACRRGFRTRGPWAERHGSWEIAFLKPGQHEGDLDRFIFLSFTPLRAASHEGDVEIRKGASEMGKRFASEVELTVSVAGQDLSDGVIDEILRVGFQRAVDSVVRMEPSDLKEVHDLLAPQEMPAFR
jgi:hypothetical protein